MQLALYIRPAAAAGSTLQCNSGCGVEHSSVMHHSPVSASGVHAGSARCHSQGWIGKSSLHIQQAPGGQSSKQLCSIRADEWLANRISKHSWCYLSSRQPQYLHSLLQCSSTHSPLLGLTVDVCLVSSKFASNITQLMIVVGSQSTLCSPCPAP